MAYKKRDGYFCEYVPVWFSRELSADMDQLIVHNSDRWKSRAEFVRSAVSRFNREIRSGKFGGNDRVIS